MYHKIPSFVIAAAATCAISIIAYAENRIDTQRADAPELAAYGTYNVGVRTLEFINPGQVDILKIDPKAEKSLALPTYNRPLTVEVWYPGIAGATGDTAMRVYLRDGKTEATIVGKAVRDADPTASGQPFPLVLISHGYPGNRFLLSHLAENIASKGYVVASIDHTDSTYRTKSAFGSTLVNRPLDQLFVLDQMAAASRDTGSFLNGLLDASNAGLIGYSMGGYGALITAGGGVTQASVDFVWGAPQGTLGIHLSGSDTHNSLPDARIKTAIAFGPWGMNTGFWDADTLKGVKIPMLFVAGSVDSTSGYETGTRAIWQGTTGVNRALLTYENANNNAGAPMPAPVEANVFSETLGWNVSQHYNDAVWDNVRMNNIAQHFVTAWLGQHLKADTSMEAYLNLVPNSKDGIWAKADDGSVKPEHTYWAGFPKLSAVGLRYETLKAGK
jgi:predicted dienelactone hydrolase